MKKVDLELMKDYHYLSAVENVQGKVIFTDTLADLERNDYTQFLHVLSDKDEVVYTSEKRINYDIVNDEILLKEGSDNETSLYTLSLEGKKELLCKVPLNVNTVYDLSEDYYLLSATVNMGCPDYCFISEEERQAYKDSVKENEDYIVLNEYPFFYNGAGFINGDRSNLFLMNRKDFSLKRITPATMDTESVRVDQGCVYFLGNDYKDFKDLYTNAYVYKLSDDSLTEIYHNERNIYLKQIQTLNGKVYVFASVKTLIDGSNIYELSDGKLNMVVESEWMFSNSVGSDVHFGRNKNSSKDKDDLYLMATDHNHTTVFLFDGKELKRVSDYEGDVSDISVKDGRIIVISLYDMKLQEVYEVKNGNPVQLTHINEEVLKGRYVARPEMIKVFNLDEIEGFVLKPIDYDENKKYPCILDIHGGPKTAYGAVFFHEMQVWASLGYFVIFCNPHCSDGRGNAFADYLKHYGATDYDDIMMFVDKALELYPAIDKDRLGVTGGSYGGYMTNWIITHTDRFQCAATQRSISNRVADFFYSDYSFDVTHENGVPLDKEFMKMSWNRSPLKYWENLKTPTLFIQSTLDFRCPFPEALQLYSALKFRGVETRLCGFKGENHELSRSGKPKHRLRRLEEITSWMNRYLMK